MSTLTDMTNFDFTVIDDDEDVIAAIVSFHGTHDQKTHGRRKKKSSTEVKPRAGTFIGNVPETHKNARPQVDEARRDGVIKNITDHGKWGTQATDATIQAARDAYNFDDPVSGLRSEVVGAGDSSGVRVGLGSIIIRGKIYNKKGDKVGDFTRRWRMLLSQDDVRSIAVTHEHLDLDRKTQGGGFSQRFNAQAEEVYRQMGVTHIDLRANMTVGGYAWATQGYDFKTLETLEEAMYVLESNYKLGAFKWENPQVTAELEALKARITQEHFDAGTAPKPIELAMVGKDFAAEDVDGRLMWFGKSGMMSSSWNGVKVL